MHGSRPATPQGTESGNVPSPPRGDPLQPEESFIALSDGRFRTLRWPGDERLPATVMLHGLGAMAEVWERTVNEFTKPHGALIALDQRGHGKSAVPSGRGAYTAGRMVLDVLQLFAAEKLVGPRLVGHSMGGRIAMVLASRFPESVRSVAIVDIGPEAWKANSDESVRAIEERPQSFASRAEAVAFAAGRRSLTAADEELFLKRLRKLPDGSYVWAGSPEAMVRTVRTQRLRSYWREWQALRAPALMVRGGRTREVRRRIVDRMLALNPRVEFVEIVESSHNVPLIAPARLAEELEGFWRRGG